MLHVLHKSAPASCCFTTSFPRHVASQRTPVSWAFIFPVLRRLPPVPRRTRVSFSSSPLRPDFSGITFLPCFTFCFVFCFSQYIRYNTFCAYTFPFPEIPHIIKLPNIHIPITSCTSIYTKKQSHVPHQFTTKTTIPCPTSINKKIISCPTITTFRVPLSCQFSDATRRTFSRNC